MDFEITKIGERGQVVIPQSFRDDMGIQQGDKFIVLERGDMIILKKLKSPTEEDVNKMFNKAQEHAKKHNLKEEDMFDAIKKARK